MDKFSRLNEWASQLTVEDIQNLSDTEIKEYAMERPGHPGQFGFVLDPKHFTSIEHQAKISTALIKRLSEVKHEEVKKGFVPEQCVLWKKQNIKESDVAHEVFDLVETYIDTNHLWRYLLKCKECGQLYLFEFYEEVNWAGKGNGNDYQYSTWIPVSSEHEAEALKGKSPLELLDPELVPKIQGDLTPFRETPIHWVK